MDRATVAVYEHVAAEYSVRRQPTAADTARAFGRRIARGALRADLGCGPGRYTAALGEPLVALDAAKAMLDLVPGRAPTALRIQGDLEALPFRNGALAGAWANVSYQHIARAHLPLALAHLHRCLRVGSPVEITLFDGDGEGPWPGDDFPGRVFVFWRAADVRLLLEGAGFGIDSITVESSPKFGSGHIRVLASRLETLPDIVGPDMRVLVCGLNPSIYAAAAGVHYARPGNRLWPAALAAGLVTRDRDPWDALRSHAIGWTDLVKRASVGAAELAPAEYEAGLRRLAWTVRLLRPRVVCFVGLAGWRAAFDRRARAGPLPDGFAGARAYLMPNPSGLNAHTSAEGFADHLRAAVALANPD